VPSVRRLSCREIVFFFPVSRSPDDGAEWHNLDGVKCADSDGHTYLTSPGFGRRNGFRSDDARSTDGRYIYACYAAVLGELLPNGPPNIPNTGVSKEPR